MRGEILLFLILSGLWSLSSCEADRQFYYVTEKMTWSNAQSYCRNNYHDLASLLNMEDNSNLLKNRELHMDRVNTARAWIGLYDDMRNWTWSLNSTGHHSDTHFTNWKTGQPDDQRGNQICTVINDAGYWKDELCDNRLYPVCYNGSAYFFQDTKRSWFEAQKYCRDEHMDLPRVMDKTENTEISKILRWYTWLGLYRKPWAYWSEQLSVNFTHWDVGKPDKLRPVKARGCAAINTDTGKWVHPVCATKLPFVCQGEAEQPQHQARLKVKISSGADMNDPEVQRQLLQQVHAMLEKQGMSDFKLRWTQRDGNIFHKEEEEPKKKN